MAADHAPVMIWLAGADRKCVYVNRMWLEFTGRPLQAELGFGWSENIHPEDRARVLETYERAFEQRTAFEARFRLRRRDGAWRWFDDHGVPVLNERDFEGFAGSCTDVTDRDEFLGVVSHELRSPLNGIKSWTHLLENLLADAQPPVHRALAGIMIGVDHQVRLIDALLDVDPAQARMLRGSAGALHWQKGLSMTDRKSATQEKAESDKRRANERERPQRGPDPDTLEGPGDRHEAEGESDAGDAVTRRGEL